jgi:hypothetical protein
VRGAEFENGRLGLGAVGVVADLDRVDPCLDFAEPFRDIEALLVDGDGGAFVAPDFGIVPGDSHRKQ